MRGKHPQNRIGQRYGKLTVIGMIPAGNGHGPRLQCRCDCGNVITRSKDYVITRARSCGCDKAQRSRSPKSAEMIQNRIDNQKRIQKNGTIIGCQFGRLTVIGHAGDDRKAKYLCACSCGNTVEVSYYALVRGETRSCGCLAKEMSRERIRKRMETGDAEDRRDSRPKVEFLGDSYDAKQFALLLGGHYGSAYEYASSKPGADQLIDCGIAMLLECPQLPEYTELDPKTHETIASFADRHQYPRTLVTVLAMRGLCPEEISQEIRNAGFGKSNNNHTGTNQKDATI